MPKYLGVGDVQISDRAKKNVEAVLSTRWLSYGPYSKAFEGQMAKEHDHKFACFVNSGTSALQIGLGAMKEKYGWPDGAGILVPALTFVASVNTIIQNNLTPIFHDIELDYYELDPAKPVYLGANSKPVAIMPVHLFGQPVNPAWYKWARKHEIKIIDDSCETMFVNDEEGYVVGSRADVACYSTFACHIITTGVGGFALTSDPELAMLIRSLANHGRDGIYFEDVSFEQKISKRFSFERVGYSYRATELEAALGVAQLEERTHNILSRNANADQLNQGLRGLPLKLPRARGKSGHAWMMYPILARDEQTRDKLELYLERHNIETRRMVPLTNQPIYKKLFGEDFEERFPNAREVNRRGLYVGCHPGLTEDDIKHIITTFQVFNF